MTRGKKVRFLVGFEGRLCVVLFVLLLFCCVSFFPFRLGLSEQKTNRERARK